MIAIKRKILKTLGVSKITSISQKTQNTLQLNKGEFMGTLNKEESKAWGSGEE